MKMVLITILVGLIVWGVMDRIVSNAVKKPFEAQLSDKLKEQSLEDRLRFDRYMQAYHQVGNLISAQNSFHDYLERNHWFSDDDLSVKHYHSPPPWFLSASALRVLAIPSFAVILDKNGNSREIYNRKDDMLPEALRAPTEYILQKSLDMTHVAAIDTVPYMFTSKSVVSPLGEKITLLLASPVDDELLIISQRDFPNRLVGMISDDNKKILTSNHPDLIPNGTVLDTIRDQYVVASRRLHDYGGSEIPIKFTSFISKKKTDEMMAAFVSRGRKHVAITAFVFILSFALIMLLITKRIAMLTERIEEFSMSALGGAEASPGHGDQIAVLEDRFQRLTEEILASHELIRKETEKRAAIKASIVQKENQFKLLRSIMDTLGIGILVRHDNSLLPANSVMLHFEDMCGDRGIFEISDNSDKERLIMDKDDNSHVFRLTSQEVTTGDKVILVRDVTEHRKLEDQLRQAQKMESIGQLAGGIAHDFNNFLTAINGYGALLKMKLKKTDPLRDYAKQILLSSDKAANLTKSLLAFSRKQIINPRPVNINEIVKQSEKLMSRLISEDIELKTILSDKELIATADSGQIEQVLMNLATNARDAMPDGGLLTIETDFTEMNSDFIRTHGYGKPGRYVLLSITDSGEGIDYKTKDKIFEPFFTTKDTGKGTGLGLAMVYGIITQHNGFINVYSEPGNGTTFKIYLPAVESVTEEDLAEELPELTGGTETILMAEDNPYVADFLSKVLNDSGYTVLVTANGEDALNSYMANKTSIQLLLLDVIMPDKNGKEVYAEIKQSNPKIKALFLSGYTADLMHKKGILEKGINFLSKPVSPDDLLRKVREILDQ